MSRIETPRSTARLPIGDRERIIPGMRQPDGSVVQIAPSAGRPRQQDPFGTLQPPQLERQPVLAVQALRPGDLAPLEGMETDRLVGELARISLALASRLAQEQDEGTRQSLDVGHAALDELFRRLSLLNSGYSSLVMKW